MVEMTRRELFPGVWLRAIHTTKFKSAYLSVTLLTQLDQKTAGANALIPPVLRRGTATHPDMEAISAALDELYGGAIEPVVRKKGETQCIGFVASFLDDAYTLDGEPILESAAALLGEFVLKPYTADGVFDADYVEGEKANLIHRLRAQINDKRTYANHQLIRAMCRDERFGVDKYGDEASVSALTPETLWARYQTLLEGASVELYYCGSAPVDRVEKAFRQAFAALPVRTDREQPTCEVRPIPAHMPETVEESMDVTQGKLALGFRTGGISYNKEEFPALLLCNAVFGGTTLSKLFMNVREKLSLCYYASSVMERMKAILIVSSGIEFEKYQQSKEEILAQLEAVQRGEIEDWELEGARRTLIGTHQAILDEQNRQEEYWLGEAVVGSREGPDAMIARLEAVTREQVAAAAQKIQLDTIYFLKGKEA